MRVEDGYTSGVVAGCKEDATGGLAQANDMAGGGGRENAIVTDDELLDAVRSANLRDQLDDLRVPEAAITSNDKGRT